MLFAISTLGISGSAKPYKNPEAPVVISPFFFAKSNVTDGLFVIYKYPITPPTITATQIKAMATDSKTFFIMFHLINFLLF